MAVCNIKKIEEDDSIDEHKKELECKLKIKTISRYQSIDKSIVSSNYKACQSNIDHMNSNDKKTIQSLPGNNKCIDCPTPNPTWASISHGTLHCFECIGKHRGLGVHISFARSIDLDTWDETQIDYMVKGGGGNEAFQSFMEGQGFELGSRDKIRQVYDSPMAQFYRDKVKARVEGRPEPTEVPSRYNKKEPNSTASSSAASSKPSNSLSSHLMQSNLVLPTPIQRFKAGFQYYTYRYILTPLKRHTILSSCTFLLYITSKCTTTFLSSTLSSSSLVISSAKYINSICRTIFLSTFSSILLASIYSIHWINTHRHEAFKSCQNLFQSRLNNGRIKRNNNKYDIYFPVAKDDNNNPMGTIGSTIQKAFLFYPESLIDITSYCNIMSKLSDHGNILIIVVNCNPPSRIVTPSPFSDQQTLNHGFRIIYEIETLMGINVKEWIVGGHGDGSIMALELRRLILRNKMKKVNVIEREKQKRMKCVVWGLSACYSPPLSLLEEEDTLFITASNDYIADNLRFERNIKECGILLPSNRQDIVSSTTSSMTSDDDGNISNPSSDMRKISYYNIQGGNHSGFGHYGPQSFPKNDGPCVISIEIQQKECWMRTLDFVLDRDPVLSSKKKD